MIIVDSLLVKGIKFVLSRIADAVESELNDEPRLREELLSAQMRLELGELSEEEFREVERDLLARLREIRERQREGTPGLPSGKATVEVTFEPEPHDR